ncbi:hypothetical protein PF011_g30731 [Phytophthora fragariae]|uniref:Uncharacterized protein n=1 Tax=Phytophthora fragariae TaxID=53985 RepID=A0A6A3GPG2_9STRA|nr:hypothetical protein PF011_g30731 [Phytophthora fragariae]
MGTTASSKLSTAQAQPSPASSGGSGSSTTATTTGREHGDDGIEQAGYGTSAVARPEAAVAPPPTEAIYQQRGLRPEAVEAAAPPPPEASSQRRKCRNSWRRRLMEPVTPVVVFLDDAHRRAAFSRGQLPCGHKVIQVSVVSSACSTGGTTASFTLRQCGYKQM